MKQASKSQKRIEFLDLISEAITHDDIFGTLNYKKKSEDQIKQFIYPHLVKDLTDYVVGQGQEDKEKAKEIVKSSINWEGDVNTTVSHIYATHYDFVLYLFVDISDDKRIQNAQGGVNELSLTGELWDNYNIKFIIA